MAYVVKLTSPSGEAYYGSEPDHEGVRHSSSTPEHAEKFETKEKAEGVFYWFKQIREFSNYSYEAVKI